MQYILTSGDCGEEQPDLVAVGEHEREEEELHTMPGESSTSSVQEWDHHHIMPILD